MNDTTQQLYHLNNRYLLVFRRFLSSFLTPIAATTIIGALIANPIRATAAPILAPIDNNLKTLISRALTSNQQLIRLKSAQVAMQNRANAAGYLPEPMVSGNYFIEKIRTKKGAQTANFMLTQPIPWPGKLGAKENIISEKAQGALSKIEALKLEIRLKIKTLYYQGFVFEKLLVFNRTEKSFLNSLSEIALAKVSVGSGGQQNVTQISLEISRLEQVSKDLKRSIATTKEKINSILNQPISNKIRFSSSLKVSTSSFKSKNGWKNHKTNLKISNPMIRTAQADINSATAKVRLSKLRQMPDIKLNFSYVLIDATDDEFDAGLPETSDAYAFGAGITIPIWRGKYNSIGREASELHTSALANYQGIVQETENKLTDIWQQAFTSKDLIQIYKNTIIPQAEQILAANQASYRQNGAKFGRVIDDFRRLLKLKTAFIKEESRFMILAAKAEKLIGNSVTGGNRIKSSRR